MAVGVEAVGAGADDPAHFAFNSALRANRTAFSSSSLAFFCASSSAFNLSARKHLQFKNLETSSHTILFFQFQGDFFRRALFIGFRESFVKFHLGFTKSFPSRSLFRDLKTILSEDKNNNINNVLFVG